MTEDKQKPPDEHKEWLSKLLTLGDQMDGFLGGEKPVLRVVNFKISET